MKSVRVPVNRRINKTWLIYTMEHYSAKKKNGIMSFFRKMDGTGDHHIK
jgi:hypothetical protein